MKLHCFDDRHTLRSLFDAAVAAADPMQFIPAALPPRPAGRILVIGAGKASARMAEAVESVWGPCEGLIITRYGHARPCRGIDIIEAAHPVPDTAGAAATQRMLGLLKGLTPDDLVIILLSGGASSLLVKPANGLTLADKQDLTHQLLASGLPIDQMNVIRKHLSAVKGGQLGAACHPAQVLALVISDVPGDDPAHIASGPTVGETSCAADALAIADRAGLQLNLRLRAALTSDTLLPRPDDPRLRNVTTSVVAAPAQSLSAAAQLGESLGFDVQRLGDDLQGEARKVAGTMAALALNAQHRMAPHDKPILLMSGGELTVTRRGNGIGGPNAEFALALAIQLGGAAGISAIACDTDGIDGAAPVAGATITPSTLARARAAAVHAEQALAANDAHSFFNVIGDQVVTGPTLTNVNDFRAVLIRHANRG
jgi:glycerate 2-kinase